MKLVDRNLDCIMGGAVYQSKPSLFILSQGDALTLPNFEITYPVSDGPSNRYTLNGHTVYCKSTKEDNIWNVPSVISNSYCSRDTIIVNTDGYYLYIESHHPSLASI